MSLLTIPGVCLFGAGFLQLKNGNRKLGYSLCAAGTLAVLTGSLSSQAQAAGVLAILAGWSSQAGAWLAATPPPSSRNCISDLEGFYHESSHRTFGEPSYVNKLCGKALEKHVWKNFGIKRTWVEGRDYQLQEEGVGKASFLKRNRCRVEALDPLKTAIENRGVRQKTSFGWENEIFVLNLDTEDSNPSA